MNRLKSFIGVIIIFVIGCTDEVQTPDETTGGKGTTASVVNDQMNGMPVVVFSNPRTQTMIAYERIFDGEELVLAIDSTSAQITLKDQFDNKWNIFGEGISDHNRGEKLGELNTIYGYWFSLVSIYDTIEIYDDPSTIINNRSLDNNEWRVPTTNLVSTGPLDTYPSIDDPKYFNAEELVRTSDGLQGVYDRSALMTVIKMDETIYLYPHNILNYHESVNDQIGELHFTLSYCPLTQTSQVWNRSFINNSTLGISGILYNNNLVLYDRLNNDYWSQILQEPINANANQSTPLTLPYFEMTLNEALQLEGTKMMLSTNTGFNREYDVDIYQSYKADQDIIYYRIFNNESQFFAPKEKVLGIVSNGRIKVYPANL